MYAAGTAIPGQSFRLGGTILSLNDSNSKSQKDCVLDPEEEPLFREFQEFVRAISIELAKNTISSLDGAAAKLHGSADRISETVEQSRDNYVALFTPVLQRVVEDNARRAKMDHQVMQQIRESIESTNLEMKRKLTFVLYGTLGLSMITLILMILLLVRG